MSKGLKRAKALQGGGDQEGDILVLESEVGFIDFQYNLFKISI